jgi:hypothetical protein
MVYGSDFTGSVCVAATTPIIVPYEPKGKFKFEYFVIMVITRFDIRSYECESTSLVRPGASLTGTLRHL